jgi:hypothetical protein
MEASGLYFRDAEGQLQHEDDAQRSAVKPSYFVKHHVPDEHVKRLDRKGAARATDNATLWIRKFAQWSQNQQHYIMRTIHVRMKGLCALYGFEFLASLTADQMRELLGGISSSLPAARACVFFATLADTVNVVGIFRQAQNPAEEARRETYRSIIKYWSGDLTD